MELKIFYKYFSQFGLLSKTNVDLPGEAATIMHKKENVGPVELATISFGQSFQITPIQMATTVSSLINGGRRVTPHFGVKVINEQEKHEKIFEYKERKNVVSEETSETMRTILESVVSEGSGKNAYIERIQNRRKDSYVSDTSEKCKEIYFLIHRICTGR